MAIINVSRAPHIFQKKASPQFPPAWELQTRFFIQAARRCPYAILTGEITKAWSGMTTRQYKKLKGLKKENLRDNMSTTEIILNKLEPVHIKIASKIIASVRLPKYSASSLS